MDIQMRNLRQVQDLRREFQSIRLVVISSAVRLGWEFMKKVTWRLQVERVHFYHRDHREGTNCASG